MELTQHREAKIIDGKKIAQEVKDDIKAGIEIVVKKGRRRPKLAVILVGDNPASQSYVRSKIKACEYVGIESQLIQLAESSSTEDILYQIDDLNEDPTVDGILVQLPLPEGIDQEKVIRWIDWTKDVDCFHPTNVGNMWIESESFAPCTPQGIAYMLKKTNIDLRGKLAVVVGRSNIVGKPMAKLLLDEDATVVIAHSKTKDLEQITKQADVLVVAVGKKHFIDSRHVKCGATVIDVGINRGEDGKLYGDVNFEDVLPIVSHITPVPGGVGPMTVAILMHNTFHCYINREY